MEIDIQYVDQIINTPCFKLAVRGHLELLECGFTDDFVLIQDHYSGFYATFNNHTVGCIIFELTENNVIWIYLAYTEIKYRNEGVFKKLLTRLIEWGLNNDVKYIEEGTHVNNTSALFTLKNANFKPNFVIHRRIIN